MAVSYGNPVHKSRGKSYQSAALSNFSALVESYNGDEVNILSEDVYSVISNPVAFSEYVERLTEGCDESTAADIQVLAENTRFGMLQESMIGGVNPIASLSMPMLRIGFPKMAIREGVPSEPVEQPKFKVVTKRPYILNTTTGEKLWLPAALTENEDQFGLPKLSREAIPATNGQILNYDLLSPIGKSAVLGDEIDPVFTVTEVTVDGETFRVGFELDTNINAIKGTVTKADDTSVCVIGSLDRAKGLLSVTALGGKLESVKVLGYISSEMNNAATQVGFDIDGVDITIGTGQPVESPINIQQMTDVMAMYDVDATLSHMETMSTVLAQRTDLDGIRHLTDEIEKLPVRIEDTFDVEPPSNYNMGEAAWREQIKIKFDRIIARLQLQYNIYQGHAVIFCNNIDGQVISNVRWVYHADQQPNDVAVSFKVGEFSSTTTAYTVLQSGNFKQGKFIILYVPAEADFKTSVYYPYSFNVIRGAVSPNTSNLAAIQMIKRYIFRTFTPMLAVMHLKNNMPKGV